MVAIRSHEADRFIARKAASGFLAFLIHGSDAGLVAERARAVLRAVVDDSADPFQAVRLSGDAVAAEPGRLADETGTVQMFGSRRAILLDNPARNLVPALEHHLKAQGATPVIVTAGALKKDAGLRRLIEPSRLAVAIECYPDEERDVIRLIETEVAEAGLSIDGDAKALLAGLLGADRLASRGEIAKLALFAHGRPAITAEDVEAVVADATALGADALVDAAFAGDLAALDAAARRVLLGPAEAGTLLGAALRHASWLHRARLDMGSGAPLGQVMAGAGRAGIGSPARRARAEQALGRMSAEALEQAVVRLGQAVAQSRRQPLLAQSTALRALWAVARSGAPRRPPARPR